MLKYLYIIINKSIWAFSLHSKAPAISKLKMRGEKFDYKYFIIDDDGKRTVDKVDTQAGKMCDRVRVHFNCLVTL